MRNTTPEQKSLLASTRPHTPVDPARARKEPLELHHFVYPNGQVARIPGTRDANLIEKTMKSAHAAAGVTPGAMSHRSHHMQATGAVHVHVSTGQTPVAIVHQHGNTTPAQRNAIRGIVRHYKPKDENTSVHVYGKDGHRQYWVTMRGLKEAVQEG